MELDLGKRTVFKVKLGDESYELKKPSVKEVGLFNTGLKQAGEDVVSQFEFTNDWLSGLGLPKEFLDSLEMDMYNKVLEAVAGIKKN